MNKFTEESYGDHLLKLLQTVNKQSKQDGYNMSLHKLAYVLHCAGFIRIAAHVRQNLKPIHPTEKSTESGKVLDLKSNHED